MKKVLLDLMGVVLVIGLLPTAGFCWIGDERLREIDERIIEIERKFLDLDEQQIHDRLIWVDWGLDLLAQDIKDIEKEMAQERETWRELQRRRHDSERAWAEWERLDRKLDEVEWKKRRLRRVLTKLKRLRYRLGRRLREVRRVSRPGSFQLGLGVGWLNRDSTTVVEFKVRILDTVDLFYGSNGYDEDGEGLRFNYLGGEILLGKIPFPFTSSATLRFQVGVESIQEDIQLSTGIMIEGRWENARGETTKGFGQVRIGLSGEEPSLTLLMGVLF